MLSLIHEKLKRKLQASQSDSTFSKAEGFQDVALKGESPLPQMASTRANSRLEKQGLIDPEAAECRSSMNTSMCLDSISDPPSSLIGNFIPLSCGHNGCF